MSCSLYRWTEKCEGKFCIGDCDFCHKEDEENEIISDAQKVISGIRTGTAKCSGSDR